MHQRRKFSSKRQSDVRIMVDWRAKQLSKVEKKTHAKKSVACKSKCLYRKPNDKLCVQRCVHCAVTNEMEFMQKLEPAARCRIEAIQLSRLQCTKMYANKLLPCKMQSYAKLWCSSWRKWLANDGETRTSHTQAICAKRSNSVRMLHVLILWMCNVHGYGPPINAIVPLPKLTRANI